MCVSDWRRSLRFYHDVLGFRFVSDHELTGPAADRLLGLAGVKLRAAFLEREGLRIELRHFASPPAPPGGGRRPHHAPGLAHLSLRVADLDAILPQLRERGVEVHEATRVELPERRARAVFVSDPDGTWIELAEQPGD